ncbi:ATP-binding protein [Micromonospora sp. PSH03]|uniref:ATP-binding protein n=1 Tax=Micromonospora TaxID=1873 RepID=UPI001B3956DA|nr:MULTISPECIES: ATP-binding protein [Micromonospora]MBQ0993519.1 ATP-binding protein [Micromonospora sp. H61]MCG5454665.1 ATP-binding protein [Micromonospora salmantinae]
MRWTILRDFDGGSTRITLAGGLTPEAEPHLAALLLAGALDAPLTLVVDLDTLTTSDVAPIGTFLARWAADRSDGPELTVSANPLTPPGRLLRATLGQHAILGRALLDHPAKRASISPYRAHLRLPPDPHSPAAARGLVARQCHAWGLDAVADQAMVIASELVSNAVQHAGTDMDITVSAVAGSLRISVRDREGDTPDSTTPALPRQVTEGGRGLPIIAALTTHWGFFAFGDGKTVWAAIDSPNGSPAGRRAAPI